MTQTIRHASAADAEAICQIYNHYVATTHISFEEAPVAVAEMAQRIGDVSARLPWLVLEQGGQLLGYAYATPWRVRSAYRFSVESSVYVSPQHGRRGIGAALYQALIAALRTRGIRVVLGGIAQPNAASVALHEHMGFQKVAHFNEVGYKFGQWIDVGYWELSLA
ncbi:MAG: N-acetyltransferase [Burkholderiales bacterium]|nr:N-acetyltransferase [Burkholderiales bacterium]